MQELIDALRCCINGSCAKCSYHTRFAWCKGKLIEHAADALEAAEKRIAELEKYCRECEEIACHYM